MLIAHFFVSDAEKRDFFLLDGLIEGYNLGDYASIISSTIETCKNQIYWYFEVIINLQQQQKSADYTILLKRSRHSDKAVSISNRTVIKALIL